MPHELYGDIHLCTSCLVAHEAPDTLTDDDRALNPLNRIGPDEHIAANYDTETGEGYAGFSWSRCDGCGSTLGGSRYRYTLWGREVVPVVYYDNLEDAKAEANRRAIDTHSDQFVYNEYSGRFRVDSRNLLENCAYRVTDTDALYAELTEED